MKQFYQKYLTVLSFLLFAIPLYGYDCQVDGIYYNLDENKKTATVTEEMPRSSHSYIDPPSYTSQSIVIPSNITYSEIKYKVTEIDKYAFYNCSNLKSVTIPNSVTKIGYHAFERCTGLTSVTIPNSVTSIDIGAFWNCSCLSSVTIPNSVTSIGELAFFNCTGLTSIVVDSDNRVYNDGNGNNCIIVSESSRLIVGCNTTIVPNYVKSIADDAFRNCSGLASVTIPNSVETIGESAFNGCSGLTSITIPNSVTSIGIGAFFGCSGLVSIVVDDDNRVYNDGNGSNCIIYTKNNYLITGCKTTMIPNSVTAISDGAFERCSSLTSITIPNSVTSIGTGYDHEGYYRVGAFTNCTNLISVTIPNSVTSIADDAFSYCSGLTSVMIPNSVKSIGERAFEGCKCVIILDNEKPPYATIRSFGSNVQTIVPLSAVDTYRQSEGWRYIPINQTMHVASCTQSKVILLTNSLLSNVSALCDGKTYYPQNDTILISDLLPDSTYTIYTKGFYGDYDFSSSIEVKTLAVKPSIQNLKVTNTTISLLGKGAGDVKNHGFASFEGKEKRSELGVDTLTVTGLSPGTDYEFTYYIVDASGKRYEVTQTVKTKDVNPIVRVDKITNTTLTLTGGGSGDAIVKNHGFVGYEEVDTITVKGLAPGKTYYYTYYIITNEGKRYESTMSVTTKNIILSASASIAPTSLSIQGSYENMDATITDIGFEDYQGKSHIELYGLNPGSEYVFTYYIVSKEGGMQAKDFTFRTEQLTMSSLPPKVVKDGNVIVAATTNLDDNETNVGFEWRRIDWTDDFPSNTGSAVIYKGQIEGYIRNVNSNYLWRVRPYYLSNSGTYYYGDWIGMDPSNTSYFDPTVHTYEKIEVKGNTAMLKGYAINGTDKVTVQGFKYWKSTTAAVKERDTAPLHAPAVPSDAVTVEASGQVMTASLLDLAYNTTYNYVAFVTTSEGDTFYGEIESFTTEEDPDARFKGDVNEDEKVDISDIVAVINQIAGTATYKYADVNGDNKVDISDIVAIINEIASH